MTKRKPQIRVCSRCMFSTWDPVAWTMAVGAGWPGRLACVNCADAPGQLRQVSPGGTCRNFRPRRKEPIRTRPAVDPRTVINPWTTHKVPRGSNVCRIPLNAGLFATVDARDFKKLSKHRWVVKHRGKQVYAVTRETGKIPMYMHRVIMRAPKGMVVDHIDGNGLNNCRCNLRLCTPQENAANKKGPLGASGYIGVHAHQKVWQACFMHKGVVHYSGGHATALEAAKARDRMAYELSHGHARLNFPEDFPAWRPGRKLAKKVTSDKKQVTSKRKRV